MVGSNLLSKGRRQLIGITFLGTRVIFHIGPLTRGTVSVFRQVRHEMLERVGLGLCVGANGFLLGRLVKLVCLGSLI